MYNGLEENRDKWARISKSFFKDSKKWLKYGTILQWIAFSFTILNIILNWIIILLIPGWDYPIGIALQFVILFCMFSYKFLMILSHSDHDNGEIIRRTSFWMDFVPMKRLMPNIDILLGKKKKSRSLTDYYPADIEDDSLKSFYKDFLSSVVFQTGLMEKNKPKLVIQFIGFCIIFIWAGFIVWLIFPFDPLVNKILLLSSIAFVGITIDEGIKLWQNINYTKKVQDIKVKLQYLPAEDNFKEYFIYECMRLEMEYSILMNRIIPIPDKLYHKNQKELDKKYDDIMKDLEPKLQKK